MDKFKAFRIFNEDNRTSGRVVDTSLDELPVEAIAYVHVVVHVKVHDHVNDYVYVHDGWGRTAP